MNEQPGNSTIIGGLLQRLAAGDEAAREELITRSVDRLRRLARKMLEDDPAVHRWNQTDDVLQNALVRLHRALQTVTPESPRRFIGLAALQIRRELIDMARSLYGPEGHGRHHKSDPGLADSQGGNQPAFEAVADSGSFNVNDMTEFHKAVKQLNDDQREVFELSFYQGMTQAEIADIVGVSTKTIKRRWRDARLELQRLLGGDEGPG